MINIKDIIIDIFKDKIVFSLKKQELVKIVSFNEEINDNVINDNEIIFSEEYILNNIKIISNFINGISLDKNIDNIHITSIKIAPIILKVFPFVKNVTKIYIDDDEEINNEICDLILHCKYIKNVNCHSAPTYMLNKFDEKGIIVDFRKLYISDSDFINDNDLTTYSKIYYKDNIKFDKELNNKDKNEFISFLKINNHLKTIDVYNYSFDLLNEIVKILEDNNVRDINIFLRAEIENAAYIQNCLEYLKTLDKIYKKKLNIDFKIKYSNEYRKKNTLKQVSMNIVVGCCFILNFLMLFGFVYSEYNNYMTNKSIKSLDKLTKVEVNNNEVTDVNQPVVSENIDIDDLPEQETSTKGSYGTGLSENYQNLLKINKDTVGWLKVNNTPIDYPVVRANDNDYYLNHGFYKNKTVNGWVFMDFRNDPENLGRNTIIYGHNLRNGTMFGDLKKVTTSSWYNNDSNLNITFNTTKQKMTWRVFSIYVIDVTNDYIYTYFSDDADFTNFLNKIKGRSFRNFNVDVSASDKILTLSTCQSNGTKRLVVHAKLIK